VDELPHEVEDAVPRPRVLSEIGGRVALAGGWHGRIASAAELPLIERKEARLGASEVRGDVDQIRVHREVRETAAVGEERLARVAVRLVLRMASSTSCPLSRFFSSAAKIGIPFRKSTMSRLFVFFEL